MSDCIHRRDPDTCEMCLWDEFERDRAPDDASGMLLAERLIAKSVPLVAISDAQERVDHESHSLGVHTEERPYKPVSPEDAAKVKDILQRLPALLGPPSSGRIRRTPEEQRQFDVDALIRILEQQAGIPRRNLERCKKCDAYRVRGADCVIFLH